MSLNGVADYKQFPPQERQVFSLVFYIFLPISPFSNSHKCIAQNAEMQKRKRFQALRRKHNRWERYNQRTQLFVRHPTYWTAWSSRTEHTETRRGLWTWKVKQTKIVSYFNIASDNNKFERDINQLFISLLICERKWI